MTEESTAQTAEEEVLNSIVNAGEATPDDEPSPESDPAPAEGNTDQEPTPDPSPESGQPEDEAGAQSAPDPKPEAKPEGEDDAAPKPDDPKEGDEPSEDEELTKAKSDLRLALLGSEPEADTMDALREKYAAASQEGHRLNEEAKSFRSFLEEKGLELVTVSDGKLGLVATDKYSSEVDISAVVEKMDIAKVYDSLSDEDKEALGDDAESILTTVAEKLARKAAGVKLASNPPVTATRDEVQISDDSQGRVWESFVAKKMPDGKTPLYADADNAEVVKDMVEAFNRPGEGWQKFRDFALESEANYDVAIEMSYLKAFQIRTLSQAVTKVEQDELQRKTEQNKAELTVHAGGADVAPKGMQSPKAQDTEQDLLDSIVKASYA